MGNITTTERKRRQAIEQEMRNKPWRVAWEPIADLKWDGLRWKVIPLGYITIEIRRISNAQRNI